MRIGERFEIRRTRGAGAQAEVYEAFDRAFGELVALKVYSGEFDFETLTREYRAVCELTHPHLVQVYDLLFDADQAAIAMELFDASLNPADYRDASGAPRVEGISRVETALVSGLTALHTANIIHGDIKPSNIMVAGDRIALSDFGLSRRFKDRRPNLAAGTPSYLAPELVTGRPASPESDLFAVGVVLVECASGVRPRLSMLGDRLTLQHPWLTNPESLKAAFPNTHERLVQFLSIEADARGRLAPLWPGQRARLPLVGREPELKVFSACEEKVRATRKSIRIDVEAPSGLGKSRLVQEARMRMATPTLYVRCHPREVMAFATVDALLEQIIEMGSSAHPHSAARAARLRTDLYRATIRRLGRAEAVVGRIVSLLESVAQAGGLNIFIDDAQWGDEDSGRLISTLLGLDDLPILLVVAYRPSDAPETLLSALLNRAVDARIRLEPLADRDVVRLVGARDDIDLRAIPSDRVVERCGGHPFLATYLTSEDFLSTDEASDRFTDRLATIHPAATELCLFLRAAGSPLTRHVLLTAAMNGDADAAFQALLTAQLLSRAGPLGEVELSHERLIEPAWHALDEVERGRIHGRLASALQSTQASAEQVALQAHLAGNVELAKSAAQVAADRAFDARAFRRAAAFESILLQAAELSDQPEAVTAHRHRIADALAQAGNGTAAAEQLLRIAKAAHRESEVVEAELKAAQYLLAAGEVERGTSLIRTVAVRLGQAFPRGFLARVSFAVWERIKLWWVDLDRVEIRPRVLRTDGSGLIIKYCWLLAAHFGLYEAHPGAQARMLRLAAQTGRADDLARALATELAYAAVFGFRSAWIEKVERSLARLESRISANAAAYALFARGFADLCAGRYQSAEQAFRRSVQRAATERSATEFVDVAYLYGFAASAIMGNFEEVLSVGREVRRAWMAENRVGLVALFDTFVGYHIDLRAGRPRVAIRRLRRASMGPGTSSYEYVRTITLASVLCAAHRPRVARRLLWRNRWTLLTKSTEVHGRTAIAWSVFLAWADVPILSSLRRWALRWVVRWIAGSGHPAAIGLAKLGAGVLDLRAGRVASGQSRLEEARQILESIGMRSYVQAVDELLQVLKDHPTDGPTERSVGSDSLNQVWQRYFRPAWPERGL